MQLPTIEVNQRNYQERLDCITKEANTKEANKFGDTDLRFLAEFNQLVKQKYQVQIQEDHASLSPGLRVLEDMINSIRGIVEIEQAQSDHRIETQNRNFQNGVAVVGVVKCFVCLRHQLDCGSTS